ncbi:hypothetical protein GIW81_08485 [Hyphomicrobium sp. xq]|uniref:Uncharacterized protein n=1 Tax=Hyphomicrobium album TaxID=2665159 RepID=A0A6I3KIZ0_9HYPH|nr:hypothetical protein [Hyphomicrobium album]MTD94369.1 hypothetical protein [Hyphomicrobium album]
MAKAIANTQRLEPRRIAFQNGEIFLDASSAFARLCPRYASAQMAAHRFELG